MKSSIYVKFLLTNPQDLKLLQVNETRSSIRWFKNFGSVALSGKMLPLRIVENNKIYDYFIRQVRLSKW